MYGKQMMINRIEPTARGPVCSNGALAQTADIATVRLGRAALPGSLSRLTRHAAGQRSALFGHNPLQRCVDLNQVPATGEAWQLVEAASVQPKLAFGASHGQQAHRGSEHNEQDDADQRQQHEDSQQVRRNHAKRHEISLRKCHADRNGDNTGSDSVLAAKSGW